MDLSYSQEEVAFRRTVRAWIDEALPPALKARVEALADLTKEEVMGWHRILADKGWVAPHWPEEWGGTGWNVVERYIFEEELGLAGAPHMPGFGLSFCAPVLFEFGTDDQKKRFLPRIYDGTEFWSQGYSEPGAGSDLSALKTRAERDGDHYVVTGQKIWTTLAQWSDWMFCLVRTDSTTARPQAGISVVLIHMRSPGVEVRPLYLMDGRHELNVVFLDGVRVPVANRIHEEGQGWAVAKFLLGYERLNAARIGIAKRTLASLKRYAQEQTKDGRALIEDVRFRDRVSRVEVELMALELTNLRFLDKMRRTGQAPGAEVSVLKLKGTEIHQALSELMLQAAGPRGQVHSAQDEAEEFESAVATRYLNLRKLTLAGGTSEIQRNIIAKAALGL